MNTYKPQMFTYVAKATFNTRPTLTRETREFQAAGIGIASAMAQTSQVWGNIHPGCCMIGEAIVQLKK
jgi:hypothetical protein